MACFAEDPGSIPALRKSINLFLHALLAAGVCSVMLLAAGCSVSSQPNTLSLSPGGPWEARLALPAESGPAGLPLIPDGLVLNLEEKGISATLEQQASIPVLTLAGGGGLIEACRLLYGDLKTLGVLFQAGSHLILNGAVGGGESLTITLEANPSTGYTWDLLNTDFTAIQETAQPIFKASHSGGLSEGAPQEQVFSFYAPAAAQVSLEFVYRRPWEDLVSAGPTLLITAPQLADLADLSSPYDLPAPMEIPSPVGAAPLAVESLPTRWDWREQAVLPPVRNQGNCGSCWAFATVGTLETNIAIQDKKIVDLSEQYLVSCNNSGWSCAQGGGTAHPYHYTSYWSLYETGPGAVLESVYPYTARDDACDGPNPHAYKIEDWHYINYSPANVEAIKQAIYTNGPVKASICAGSVFSNYHSGIYATDEKSTCGGSTNHAIVLTGWDDTQNGGIWYLRNSWGAGWGEGGYMRIAWGVSNVGLWASYIDYDPPIRVFIPLLRR